MYRLRVMAKDSAQPFAQSSPIEGLLRDGAHWRWERIVVNKVLSTIDCNSYCDLWGVDATGRLYHRLSEEEVRHYSHNHIHAYEPEEAASNENFFLLPGETLDTAVWRRVNPFKHGLVEDQDNIVTNVVVGHRTVWCVDNHGKLYLRTGSELFRRVTGPTEAKEFYDNVKDERDRLSRSFRQSVDWRNATRMRYPHVVVPNAVGNVFEDHAEAPDLQKLLVTFVDVDDEDVLNAVSISGKFWFRFRPQRLSVITANEYKKIWDDTNSGASEELGIWRPVPLSGYQPLGDFAERSHLSKPLTHNFESPNNYVLCASEDPAQYQNLGEEDRGFANLPPLLTKAAKFNLIYRTKGARCAPLNLYRPVPQYHEYAALGCVATTKVDGPDSPDDLMKAAYCVHVSVLLLGTLHTTDGRYQEGALWSTEEIANGDPSQKVALWEVTGIQHEGLSSGAFVARSGQEKPAVRLCVLNIAEHSNLWNSR